MTKQINVFSRFRGRPGRGFSLPEVLMVLAILLALISLLMPVLSGIRESVQTVHCRSALHQLGVGFQGYLIDHHNTFPDHRKSPGVHGSGASEIWWGTSIGEYLATSIQDPRAQEFFHCAGIGAPQVDYGISWNWDFCQHHVGYGYNGWFLGIRLYNDQSWGVYSTHGGRRMAELRNPAENMLLADSTVKGDGRWSQSLWWPYSAENGLHEGVSGRHRNGANVAFNDGHVAWHDKLDINPATNPYWDPRTRFWDPLQRTP